jgi:Mg2+ and Co2+ transporter CorA
MLVNCVAYQEGTKLSDIPKEDISEYVKRPDCLVWVGLKDPTPGEIEEMREEFGLHERPSKTRTTATSGRRSKSTETHCSLCCRRSRSRKPSFRSEKSTFSSAPIASSRFA